MFEENAIAVRCYIRVTVLEIYIMVLCHRYNSALIAGESLNYGQVLAAAAADDFMCLVPYLYVPHHDVAFCFNM